MISMKNWWDIVNRQNLSGKPVLEIFRYFTAGKLEFMKRITTTKKGKIPITILSNYPTNQIAHVSVSLLGRVFLFVYLRQSMRIFKYSVSCFLSVGFKVSLFENNLPTVG